MGLYEQLQEYRKLTVSMIDKVKHQNEFDEDVEARQKVVNELKNIKFTKEEIKGYVEELGIKDLDKQLEYEIKKERKRIQEELVKNRKNKIASAKYAQNSFNSGILNITK